MASSRARRLLVRADGRGGAKRHRPLLLATPPRADVAATATGRGASRMGCIATVVLMLWLDCCCALPKHKDEGC